MLWLRVPLALLAVAVLAAAGFATLERGPGKPVATKYGVTSQGRAFELSVDGDGQPVGFDTEISAPCPSGRMVSMPWAPVEGDGVRFRRDGDRLRLAEKGDTYRLAFEASNARGGALRGTMTLVVHVRPKTRAAYDCTSPRVRVTAGR